MFNKIHTLLLISIQKYTFTFHEILWFDMYVDQHNIVNSNGVKYINTTIEHLYIYIYIYMYIFLLHYLKFSYLNNYENKLF